MARKFKYLLPFVGEELDYSYRFYPLCGNAKSSAKSNFFYSIFFLVRIRALQKRENDNKIFCFWKVFFAKVSFHSGTTLMWKSIFANFIANGNNATPDFDNKREDANMEIGKYSNDYPARGSFACRITFAKKKSNNR